MWRAPGIAPADTCAGCADKSLSKLSPGAALSRASEAVGKDKTKSRWATVKGVFGALGKFKRDRKMGEAASRPSPAPSPGAAVTSGSPVSPLPATQEPSVASGTAAASVELMSPQHAPCDLGLRQSPDVPAEVMPVAGDAVIHAAPESSDQKRGGAAWPESAAGIGASSTDALPLGAMSSAPIPFAAQSSPPQRVPEEERPEELGPQSAPLPKPKPSELQSSEGVVGPGTESSAAAVLYALGQAAKTEIGRKYADRRSRDPPGMIECLLASEAAEADLRECERAEREDGGLGSDWRAEGSQSTDRPLMVGAEASAAAVLYSLEQAAKPAVGSGFQSKPHVLLRKRPVHAPAPWMGAFAKPGRRFSADRYSSIGKDAAERREIFQARVATENEARERARRKSLAASATFFERRRLEMEGQVVMEMDNLERQRNRIQVGEEEEEERWRRIESCHLHASTPLHLSSERKATLPAVLHAEAQEQRRRIEEDGKQYLSGRKREADYFRQAVNAELSKIVWPAVESKTPAGEGEAVIPPSRSRGDTAAVINFCASQRSQLLASPRRRMMTLDAMKTARKPPCEGASHDPRQESLLLTARSSPRVHRVIHHQVDDKDGALHGTFATSVCGRGAPASVTLGWLDSLRSQVAHLAGEAVGEVSHFAEQTKSALAPLST